MWKRPHIAEGDLFWETCSDDGVRIQSHPATLSNSLVPSFQSHGADVRGVDLQKTMGILLPQSAEPEGVHLWHFLGSHTEKGSEPLEPYKCFLQVSEKGGCTPRHGKFMGEKE